MPGAIDDPAPKPKRPGSGVQSPPEGARTRRGPRSTSKLLHWLVSAGGTKQERNRHSAGSLEPRELTECAANQAGVAAGEFSADRHSTVPSPSRREKNEFHLPPLGERLARHPRDAAWVGAEALKPASKQIDSTKELYRQSLNDWGRWGLGTNHDIWVHGALGRARCVFESPGVTGSPRLA